MLCAPQSFSEVCWVDGLGEPQGGGACRCTWTRCRPHVQKIATGVAARGSLGVLVRVRETERVGLAQSDPVVFSVTVTPKETR